MSASVAKAVTFGCLAAWTAVATAQGPDEEDLALAYGDKDTVSIATGAAQALRSAPAVATVITAGDIAAMGATDLDEVLESVPGLHVSRASVRYSPLYIVRGIGGGGQTNPQLLVLQNGIPVTRMYYSDKGAAWVGVPVENVARIEIIRGPGSALYGADAFAGVINIITKTAADTPGTEAGLRGGSLDTWSAWTQHGGKLGPMDVAAYLRIGSTGGPREVVRSDAQTRNDARFGTRASLAPGPINVGHDAIDGSLNVAHGKWRARAAYKQRNDLQTGAGVSSALDPGSVGRVEDVTADLSWTDANVAPDWSAGATAGFLSYAFTFPRNLLLLPAGARLATGTFPEGMVGGPNQWERQFRLSAFAAYTGLAHHQLRFGAGHDDLDLYKTRTYKNYQLNAAGVPVPTGPVIDYSDIQPFIRPQRRLVDYLYAQDEWKFARDWTLTAGVRHDRYSDFGDTTNPRLALVWDASLDLTAKLLYGRAFRAPSFNEQYGINPVANGNPLLRPETIETVEAAFSWRARQDVQLVLNVFRSRLDSIIRLVANPAPAPGATYMNTGGQHGDGLELEAAWDYSRSLRITGNYAYQQSIDEASGQDAGYAPRHHLYLRADWRHPGGWFAGTQLNRVTDRRRAAGDSRPAVPDYTTVDLILRSPRHRGWEFAASIRNLFDADVREPSLPPGLIPDDLPMAPRTAFFQASYRL